MSGAKLGIFVTLGMFAAAFLVSWVAAARKAQQTLPATDAAAQVAESACE